MNKPDKVFVLTEDILVGGGCQLKRNTIKYYHQQQGVEDEKSIQVKGKGFTWSAILYIEVMAGLSVKMTFEQKCKVSKGLCFKTKEEIEGFDGESC